MPKERGTTGKTVTSDDRKDRRTVIVPDELWKHVRRWAKTTDKSEAAVIRAILQLTLEREAYLQELRSAATQFFSPIAAETKKWQALHEQQPSHPEVVATLQAIEATYDALTAAFMKLHDNKIFLDPVFGLPGFEPVLPKAP